MKARPIKKRIGSEGIVFFINKTESCVWRYENKKPIYYMNDESVTVYPAHDSFEGKLNASRYRKITREEALKFNPKIVTTPKRA